LHAAGLDGRGVALAIVDFGINLPHLLQKRGLAATLDPASSWVRSGAAGAGAAPVGHGTMCAFDALIAAPKATLLDIAVLANYIPPTSVTPMDALLSDAVSAYAPLARMMLAPNRKYQSLVVSNSWGLSDSRLDFPKTHPNRYVDNGNHLFNQAVAALVAAGADVVFAAGNCGPTCPSVKCGPAVPPYILGANSHPDVITVGGVDVSGHPAGYSSPGPGALQNYKPDLSTYTHFLGSEATGAGQADEGTSASCPVLAGLVAALRSKFPFDPSKAQRSPAAMKQFLIAEAKAAAGNPPFSSAVGWGMLKVDTVGLNSPNIVIA